jgi:hypothetical protein
MARSHVESSKICIEGVPTAMEIAITMVKLRLEDQGYRRERLIGNNPTRKEQMSPNGSEHMMIQPILITPGPTRF